MHANKENPVEEAMAGHIYAAIGLKDTTTGDTLSDINDQIVLESMTFPDPVIQVAIEPKTKGDQEKARHGHPEGSRPRTRPSRSTTTRTPARRSSPAWASLHLDILVDRMKREFKVEANVGKPQVAYRETIRRPVLKYDYTHKKQTGGSGQFAKVQVEHRAAGRDRGRLDVRVRQRCHRWSRAA